MGAAFKAALKSAGDGLTWEYACLIWLADYLAAETGRDPAHGYRAFVWDERNCKRELAALAKDEPGATAVERALRAVAKHEGWAEAQYPCPGSIGVYVGCYAIPDPSGGASEGFPAIWDGQSRWLTAALGRASLVARSPDIVWQVPRYA